ncbi:ABC transporter ATP-binding protein [Pelagibius litoralis]|uniref:ABC transporter ATP-binding protein n=1 Tax=Pelagibius litoralis TaxID=374515 RepID=A0A967F3L2_9PROT|nr:ABC transporter ATP-binding protein [Pelagibius litoralis]NIA72250.1 ABC transporter ATP-binding protein [Pelagibius litoralis]
MESAAATPEGDLVTITGLTREFSSGGGLMTPRRTMRAVNDVSLRVPRGKVTGVVGESGCGKSTLARLVLRLIDATAGTVAFEGTDLANRSPGQMRKLRRRMQMVFQDPYSAIDPRYTIRRALLEPFQVQGVAQTAAEARAAVDELISMVGLSPRMVASFPHQLSGGQKQRVGIARALALRPSFLVLDEPTASLDVSIQAQIIDLLEALKEDLGLTYLFISHDLSLVRYFCDRVVVMYLGRAMEILPDATARPRHHYAHALLDSNFEPDPARRKVITMLDGEIPSPFAVIPGCAFADRCPAASDLCRRERPVLTDLGGGHMIACHHPRD